MVVKILPNEKQQPTGKLADAELHFSDGVLEGLKLIGFSVWERRGGGGRNVTFPARQYSVNGERRSFALLRPVSDTTAQARVRDLVPAGVRRVRGADAGRSRVANKRPGCRLVRHPDLGFHRPEGVEIMRVRSIRNIAAGDPREAGSWAANATSTQASTALTEAEAAQFIGMSAAWLKKSRTKRFRGVIDAPPFIRAGVKRVVYRVEDLETWQERHIEHVGPNHPNDASNGLAISRTKLRSEMAVG